MKKTVVEILNQLDEAFKVASEDIQEWSNERTATQRIVHARARLIIGLLDMFGTWTKRNDVIEAVIDWLKTKKQGLLD